MRILSLESWQDTYSVVGEARDPDQTLLAFLESAYEAAANLANWDRAAPRQTWFK